MANTETGRALTEAHRVAQIRLGGAAMLRAAGLWSLLDVGDLDGSAPVWMAATADQVGNAQAQSAAMAERYVSLYREAEIGTQSGPIVRPLSSTATTVEALRIKGPVGIKTAIGRGVTVERAYRAGMIAVQGMVMQLALGAGRGVIDGTARADGRSGRYRRVTDGTPCAFCAMLAGRGPVYSEETAYFRTHLRCGCTAEIVYGEWVPNELEAKWRESYFTAAEEATAVDGIRIAPKPGNDEDTVLWRMRRNAPDLFHDGVKPSN